MNELKNPPAETERHEEDELVFQPWDGSETPPPADEDHGGGGGDGDDRRRATAKKKNRKLLFALCFVILGMLGFAFANVPLFNMVCEVFGIQQNAGTEVRGVTDSMENGRDIEVLFSGTQNGQLPVRFRPLNRVQQTQVGKVTVADYEFVNMSDRPVYFMPIHTVRPAAAAKEDMFILSECFCFNFQKLEPRQRVTMPVVYKISPDLDPRITNVTSHYTLFEVTEQDYLSSLEEDAPTMDDNKKSWQHRTDAAAQEGGS